MLWENRLYGTVNPNIYLQLIDVWRLAVCDNSDNFCFAWA